MCIFEDTYLVCSLYIGISVLCSLYITYQELFERLIRQPIGSPNIEPAPEVKTNTLHAPSLKETELFERLEKYVNSTKAWRDSDLSVKKLRAALYTNRTSLLKIIQLNGYSGYTSYINSKRVSEFIQIIDTQGKENQQQIFFDVGFRSRSTALRNFKDITGMTPSEYFQKNSSIKNN